MSGPGDRRESADRTPRARVRVTLEDVARAAGVSRALVSIVIRGAPGASEATRTRVLRIAADLGYSPDARARHLARRRSRLLGVEFNVTSAFHGDVLSGIYSAAERASYDVVLSGRRDNEDEERAVQALLSDRCDALILLGPELPEPRLAQISAALPVVVVGRRLSEPVADVVRTDDAVGMQLAIEHLASLGHRNIAHIDGGPTLKAQVRQQGYRMAMQRLGLADEVRVLPGGETVEAGVEAGMRLLGEPARPSAVLAYDDDCAWGLIATLEAGGVSVPEAISIVGFDGSRLSRLVPVLGLTTISQDADEQASLAVGRAVVLLDDNDAQNGETVRPPTLVVRSTTASVARPPDRSRRAMAEGHAVTPDEAARGRRSPVA